MRKIGRFWLPAALALSLETSQATAQDYQSYPASQGWNQSQMRIWYEKSQGSRLIPASWLQALKMPDGAPYFTRPAMEALGYTYFSDQPDAWPIGFILDQDDNDTTKSWLGFNCAACHTAKLKSGTTEVWIHGGQAMADFQSFTTGLISAVDNVATQDSVFQPFASQVLGTAATEDAKNRLKAEITDWLDLRQTINNTARDVHWGRGRADAVGVILATTAAVVADPKIPKEEREWFPESNAPVSYPFVWNANQQARLQHNGVVDNGVNFGVVKVAKIGALIRNWTEALGVFAEVKLDAKANKVISSIRIDNLLQIEQALAELQSPRWPATFGALDVDRQARGATLYKTNCGSCHGLLAADDTQSDLPLLAVPSAQTAKDPQGFVYLQPVFGKKTRPEDFEKTINPSPEFIGTDPGMACNALLHQVPAGRLEGQANTMGMLPALTDRVFADRAVTTDLLRVLIQRDVLTHKVSNFMKIAQNQWEAAGLSLIKIAFADVDNDYTGQGAEEDPLLTLRSQLQRCADHVSAARAYAPESPLPVYKARPLNGIWATAPFLHNGSVPTLYDLLLPQAERPKTFGYYDGEMDLVKGGLKDASANPAAFQFRTYNDDGYVIIGNWNGGHEYGTQLNHDQRLDLVEYLKGL